MNLTLQSYLDHQWCDAIVLNIEKPELGRAGPATLEYQQDYALRHFQQRGLPACSLNWPVELALISRSKQWFAFLDDILPSGAGRKIWVERLGIGNLGANAQDAELLRQGTIAPVGNWRVKEAVEALDAQNFSKGLRFDLKLAADRDTDFLDYANSMGAISGGASGAGGEAPKFLVRRDELNQVWIDAHQDDPHSMDRPYLVKFPRNRRTEEDQDILRGEYFYYQELADLGIPTVDTQAMQLIEGERSPSLWLPRFDIEVAHDGIRRYGMESVYSIMKAQPGQHLNQFQVVRTLAAVLKDEPGVSQNDLVFDYLRRDFLNVCFGNSDNHGRNTAVIKTPLGMRLSPVYDFAPMKADSEGITRVATWGGSPELYELGGQFNWMAIAQALGELTDPDQLIDQLRKLATKIEGLRDRLAARGMPESLLNRPALGLSGLDARLKKWELI